MIVQQLSVKINGIHVALSHFTKLFVLQSRAKNVKIQNCPIRNILYGCVCSLVHFKCVLFCGFIVADRKTKFNNSYAFLSRGPRNMLS